MLAGWQTSDARKRTMLRRFSAPNWVTLLPVLLLTMRWGPSGRPPQVFSASCNAGEINNRSNGLTSTRLLATRSPPAESSVTWSNKKTARWRSNFFRVRPWRMSRNGSCTQSSSRGVRVANGRDVRPLYYASTFIMPTPSCPTIIPDFMLTNSDELDEGAAARIASI